jgi:hypothetical protein
MHFWGLPVGDFKKLSLDTETLHMTSEGLEEMIEGDIAL